MRFFIGGQEWQLRFQHHQGPFRTSHGKRRRAATLCSIVRVWNGEIVCGFAGVAHCSLKDPFNKATGRRLALARALALIGDHSLRHAASAAYEGRARSPQQGTPILSHHLTCTRWYDLPDGTREIDPNMLCSCGEAP